MALHWLEQTADDVPRGDDWLGARERSILAGLCIPKRRADWRLGRWTAKRAIAVHLAIPLHEIEVLPAASGAPRAYVRGVPAGFRLSISHSHGVACCALSHGPAPLGCDIERIETRCAAFCADYFTPEERALIAAWRPVHEDTAITLLWCGKESALKALELGLRADPLSISVTPSFTGAGNAWQPLRARVAGSPPIDGFWRADRQFVRTVVEFRDMHCPSRSADGMLPAGKLP